MQGFVITLLVCSATMSALALLYLALTPLLAKRYSVTGRYYAWLVLVLGLLIPFRPRFPHAVIRMELPADPSGPALLLGNGPPVAAGTAPIIPWWQVAGAVWLAGAVVFLAYHAVRHVRFLRLAAHWSERVTDEETLALLQSLKDQMGISQKIELLSCESVESPMLIGLLRPRILLPGTDFSGGERGFILRHELVHHQRKDLWYKGLLLLATAVHWFNPVVYLMAKAIGIQCECSCDREVVRGMDADTRLYYSETIIGVVRRQSKRKTALSTTFYGGKNGMKARIGTIMDQSGKKAGLALLCGALALTLGTGVAFAASGAQPAAPFAYSFRPDPESYARYSAYGIAVSDDGEGLLYNGQRVRLFADPQSGTEVFFYDEGGTLDLGAVRNAAGAITGVERLSGHRAREYRSDFFAGDTREGVSVEETVRVTEQVTVGTDKLKEYAAYGVALSADGKMLSHNGQRVKLLADALDGGFATLWIDEEGTVNLSVVRNAAGQITAVERISEERAREYRAMQSEVLDGLEERVEARIKEKYS